MPASDDLPLTEWIVLALLDEAPRHGFAVARELQADAEIGRVWTVSRPLTYRAVDQLLVKGMAEAARNEPSDEGGPNRTVMHPTAKGRRAVRKWRVAPVEHLREMRSAFLVKLLLLERAGVDRRPLVDAQLGLFEPRFGGSRPTDPVERWRYESAQAARRFLEALR
jgi:PadR family transcriptional regulator AphA